MEVHGDEWTRNADRNSTANHQEKHEMSYFLLIDRIRKTLQELARENRTL